MSAATVSTGEVVRALAGAVDALARRLRVVGAVRAGVDLGDGGAALAVGCMDGRPETTEALVKLAAEGF